MFVRSVAETMLIVRSFHPADFVFSRQLDCRYLSTSCVAPFDSNAFSLKPVSGSAVFESPFTLLIRYVWPTTHIWQSRTEIMIRYCYAMWHSFVWILVKTLLSLSRNAYTLLHAASIGLTLVAVVVAVSTWPIWGRNAQTYFMDAISLNYF